MIGRTIGRYQIVRQLGAGGMGIVYHARDSELERDVAIKVLPSDIASRHETSRARFEREARTIASLDHPNICTLYDYGHDEGVPFLVMELIDGESLADRLIRGPLPLEQVLRFGSELASALARAHRKGVIHRDVKPGNVMITKTGAKLLDFGIAQVGSASKEELRDLSTARKPLTGEGEILGTFRYMAPEQLEGKEADARTDIFALGVVLYEMATGKSAFAGDSRASLIAAILSGEPRPIRELLPLTPPMLEHVIRKCLEKDPDDRWQSAHDVAAELQWTPQANVDNDVAVRAADAVTRRWKMTASILGGLLLAAIAGAIWLARSEPDPTGGVGNPLPVPQLVKLTWEPGFEWTPRITPDGASFVYLHGPADVASSPWQLYFRRIGGMNPINLGEGENPAVSPDGQLIAFTSVRDGAAGIFIMGTTGENVRRLTEFGDCAAWSPDGRKIAFSTDSFYWDSGASELWVVDVEGGTPVKVYSGDAVAPTWSPSGTRIAFAGKRLKDVAQRSIASIPATGGEAVEIFGQPSNLPQWAGDWIWFHAAVNGPTGLWRVRVDEATGEAVGDPELMFRSASEAGEPSVSKDGKRVLFSSGEASTQIFRWDFDSLHGRVASEGTLVIGGLNAFLTSVSPDGEWLATALGETETDASSLLLVRASTGETTRLQNVVFPEECGFPWAPDNSKLYFQPAAGGRSELWSIRPDGSGRELVVPSLSGVLRTFLPSPDGRLLYVEAGDDRESAFIDLAAPIEERKPIPLAPVDAGLTYTAQDWSSDGRTLVGWARKREGGFAPELVLFDVERGVYRRLVVPKGFSRRLAFMPDDRRVLAGVGRRPGFFARRPELQIIDVVTGTVTSAGSAGGMALTLSRDGRSLYGHTMVRTHDVWMLEYSEAP